MKLLASAYTPRGPLQENPGNGLSLTQNIAALIEALKFRRACHGN